MLAELFIVPRADLSKNLPDLRRTPFDSRGMARMTFRLSTRSTCLDYPVYSHRRVNRRLYLYVSNTSVHKLYNVNFSTGVDFLVFFCTSDRPRFVFLPKTVQDTV